MSKMEYKNIGSDEPKHPRRRNRGSVGNAEFNNAKRSEAAYPGKTGNSSSNIPVNSDFGFNSMSTHSEPARQSRRGKSQTASGPKVRHIMELKTNHKK